MDDPARWKLCRQLLLSLQDLAPFVVRGWSVGRKPLDLHACARCRHRNQSTERFIARPIVQDVTIDTLIAKIPYDLRSHVLLIIRGNNREWAKGIGDNRAVLWTTIKNGQQRVLQRI